MQLFTDANKPLLDYLDSVGLPKRDYGLYAARYDERICR